MLLQSLLSRSQSGANLRLRLSANLRLRLSANFVFFLDDYSDLCLTGKVSIFLRMLNTVCRPFCDTVTNSNRICTLIGYTGRQAGRQADKRTDRDAEYR